MSDHSTTRDDPTLFSSSSNQQHLQQPQIQQKRVNNQGQGQVDITPQQWQQQSKQSQQLLNPHDFQHQWWYSSDDDSNKNYNQSSTLFAPSSKPSSSSTSHPHPHIDHHWWYDKDDENISSKSSIPSIENDQIRPDLRRKQPIIQEQPTIQQPVVKNTPAQEQKQINKDVKSTSTMSNIFKPIRENIDTSYTTQSHVPTSLGSYIPNKNSTAVLHSVHVSPNHPKYQSILNQVNELQTPMPNLMDIKEQRAHKINPNDYTQSLQPTLPIDKQRFDKSSSKMMQQQQKQKQQPKKQPQQPKQQKISQQQQQQQQQQKRASSTSTIGHTNKMEYAANIRDHNITMLQNQQYATFTRQGINNLKQREIWRNGLQKRFESLPKPQQVHYTEDGKPIPISKPFDIQPKQQKQQSQSQYQQQQYTSTDLNPIPSISRPMLQGTLSTTTIKPDNKQHDYQELPETTIARNRKLKQQEQLKQSYINKYGQDIGLKLYYQREELKEFDSAANLYTLPEEYDTYKNKSFWGRLSDTALNLTNGFTKMFYTNPGDNAVAPKHHSQYNNNSLSSSSSQQQQSTSSNTISNDHNHTMKYYDDVGNEHFISDEHSSSSSKPNLSPSLLKQQDILLGDVKPSQPVEFVYSDACDETFTMAGLPQLMSNKQHNQSNNNNDQYNQQHNNQSLSSSGNNQLSSSSSTTTPSISFPDYTYSSNISLIPTNEQRIQHKIILDPFTTEMIKYDEIKPIIHHEKCNHKDTPFRDNLCELKHDFIDDIDEIKKGVQQTVHDLLHPSQQQEQQQQQSSILPSTPNYSMAPDSTTIAQLVTTSPSTTTTTTQSATPSTTKKSTTPSSITPSTSSMKTNNNKTSSPSSSTTTTTTTTDRRVNKLHDELSHDEYNEMKQGADKAIETANNLTTSIRELTQKTVETLDNVNEQIANLCDSDPKLLAKDNDNNKSLTLKENTERLIDKYETEIVNNALIPNSVKVVILAAPEFIDGATELVDSYYTLREKALHTSKDLVTSAITLATQDDDNDYNGTDHNNNNNTTDKNAKTIVK